MSRGRTSASHFSERRRGSVLSTTSGILQPETRYLLFLITLRQTIREGIFRPYLYIHADQINNPSSDRAIRLVSTGQIRHFYCPITAVAQRKTGQPFHVYESDLAVEKLGLSNELRVAIENAADGYLDGPNGAIVRRCRQHLEYFLQIKKEEN